MSEPGDASAFWPHERRVEAGDRAEWKGRFALCVKVKRGVAFWRMGCHACGCRFAFSTGRRAPSAPPVRCKTCRRSGSSLAPSALEIRERERQERQARANATRAAKSTERLGEALRMPESLPRLCKPRGGPAFARDGGWWSHALPRVGEFTKWRGAKVQCVAAPPKAMQSRAERHLWRVEACSGCRCPFTFIEAPGAPAPRLSCDVCEGAGVFG